MATWNMGQYDSIENDARRMDEIEYTRQRQAVLDKRAAQDYALRYETDKKKAAKEQAEIDQYMRTLPARQKLTDMKLQGELNALKAAQQQQEQAAGLLSYNRRPVDAWSDAVLSLRAKNGDASALSQEERDLIEKDTRFHFADKKDLYNFLSDANEQSLARFGVNLKHLPYHIDYLRKKAAQVEALKPKTPLQQLTQDVAIGRLKGEKTKQENAAIADEISKTSYDPLQKLILKFKANGNSIHAFTPEERVVAKREVGFITPEEEKDFWDGIASLSPAELEAEEGIKQSHVVAYTKQSNDSAAENAKYARQNATKIAQAQQKEVYNNVSAKIASLYNAAVNRGEIDPQKTKSKDTIEYATQIYINALKSGGQITYKQAVEQAAGLNTGTTSTQLSPSEYAKYADIYGVDFIELPKEVTANIKFAEDRAKNAAFKEGVLTIGKDGKVNFSGSLEDLQRIADYEEEIYENLGLETLSPKGYFRTILNKMLAEKQANEAAAAKAKADKSAEDATNELKRKGKSFWELMATGAYADQANAAHWASAQLGRENKSAIDDYKKQDRKLKRRGN